jgi:hypothetical protein
MLTTSTISILQCDLCNVANGSFFVKTILRVDVEREDVVRETNTLCPVAVAGGRHRNGYLIAFA